MLPPDGNNATGRPIARGTEQARSLDELEPAFDAMAKAGVQAVVLGAGGLFYQARMTIPKLAVARRLPTCVWSKETFEGGALMSYGADQLATIRRTAAFVDKILKGARPAEIPVEQPTKLQLLFNLKTAKALGLDIPPMVLARADDVIE
jgi:putative ABC transport system substrate-binding protein